MTLSVKLICSSSLSGKNREESIAFIYTIFSISCFLWTTMDLLLVKVLLADWHCLVRDLWIFLMLFVPKLLSLENCEFLGVLGFAEIVPFLWWFFKGFFFKSSPGFLLSKIFMIYFVIEVLSMLPNLKFSSNLPNYFSFFYPLWSIFSFPPFWTAFLRWVEIIDITALDDTELLFDFLSIRSQADSPFF